MCVQSSRVPNAEIIYTCFKRFFTKENTGWRNEKDLIHVKGLTCQSFFFNPHSAFFYNKNKNYKNNNYTDGLNWRHIALTISKILECLVKSACNNAANHYITSSKKINTCKKIIKRIKIIAHVSFPPPSLWSSCKSIQKTLIVPKSTECFKKERRKERKKKRERVRKGGEIEMWISRTSEHQAVIMVRFTAYFSDMHLLTCI